MRLKTIKNVLIMPKSLNLFKKYNAIVAQIVSLVVQIVGLVVKVVSQPEQIRLPWHCKIEMTQTLAVYNIIIYTFFVTFAIHFICDTLLLT